MSYPSFSVRELLAIFAILAVLILCLPGCNDQRQNAQVAANARIEAQFIAERADLAQDLVTKAVASSLINDLGQILISLSPSIPVPPTLTLDALRRDYQAALKIQGDQRALATKENEKNAADKTAIKDTVGAIGGLLGPWGDAAVMLGTMGFGIWKTIQTRQANQTISKHESALENVISYGRQMTQIAEYMAPDAVKEIKGQFKTVQDHLGITHLIEPVLAVIKAGEPVTSDDIPKSPKA